MDRLRVSIVSSVEVQNMLHLQTENEVRLCFQRQYPRKISLLRWSELCVKSTTTWEKYQKSSPACGVDIATPQSRYRVIREGRRRVKNSRAVTLFTDHSVADPIEVVLQGPVTGVLWYTIAPTIVLQQWQSQNYLRWASLASHVSNMLNKKTRFILIVENNCLT